MRTWHTQRGSERKRFLTRDCEELSYDGDAEHLPLDEEVGNDTRQRGDQPGTEIRQSGEETILDRETESWRPGTIFSKGFDGQSLLVQF